MQNWTVAMWILAPLMCCIAVCAEHKQKQIEVKEVAVYNPEIPVDYQPNNMNGGYVQPGYGQPNVIVVEGQ